MSVKNLSPAELAVWQKLQTVTENLRREVGRGLREDAQLSEPEFTVLAHLISAGGSARPSACARSIGWDTSRLAHLFRRMQVRGLIARSPEGDRDGRASVVSLTDEGRRAHRRAVGPHLRAAKEWFADALSAEQLSALDDALSALERHAARTLSEESAK